MAPETLRSSAPKPTQWNSSMPARKAPLRSSKPLDRLVVEDRAPGKARTDTARRSRTKPAEIPKRVREALAERSQGVCEVCSRAMAVHAHHRKLRRFGDHTLANLLATCAQCHARIHHDVTLAYRLGLLLFSYENPATRKPQTWGAA